MTDRIPLDELTSDQLDALYDERDQLRAERKLTEPERQFLTFALDQAADEMSLADGFTDEDEAALAKFRRMADEAQQPEQA